MDQALGAGTTDIDMIIGGDPYEMSAIVAAHLEDVTGAMDTATAIITRGDLFPDAIGVAPLACGNEWPILLTGSGTTLNTYASKALQDLNIPRALKVGTYVTLPGGVTGVGNLSGADRYVTNSNVAGWATANAGMEYWHIGMATGEKFPDALAAGPYLGRANGVLLLSPLAGPLPLSIESDIASNSYATARVTFFAMIEPVVTLVKSLLL